MKRDFFILLVLVFLLITVSFVSHILETPSLNTLDIEDMENNSKVTVNYSTVDGNEIDEFLINTSEKTQLANEISVKTGIFEGEIIEHIESNDFFKDETEDSDN